MLASEPQAVVLVVTVAVVAWELSVTCTWSGASVGESGGAAKTLMMGTTVANG